MSIESDFLAYTNALGFVSNKPNGSSGNDLLYSCEAAIVRKNLGAWSSNDDVALKNSITAYSQLEPGLYKRPGWAQDQEARDDYTGLAAYSPLYALAIQSYGKGIPFWYFKTSPSARWYEPMFWLDLAFVAHVLWCALEVPNLFLRCIWALDVALTGSSQDSLILSWLLTKVAGDKGRLERWATKRFQKKLSAAGGIKAVFAAYFNDPNHPLAKYAE